MNERPGSLHLGGRSCPGDRLGLPGRRLSAPWWEVAGRTALAGALGLPGVTFLTLQLLNLLGGTSGFRSALPTLAVATCLVAAAWRAGRGRTLLPGLLLSAYAATLAARFVGVGDPLRQGDAVAIHLLGAVLGIVWIVGRRAGVRDRTLLPVQAAALGLSALGLAAAPAAAAEIGRLLGSAIGPPVRSTTVAVGQQVPALRFTTLAGEPVTLQAPRVVYVVSFWATWCAPCLLELPELEAVARRAAADPAVRFLAVNTEDLPPERIRAFLDQRNLAHLPACLDPEGGRDGLGVRSLPLTLLVKDGRVARRFEGYRNGIGVEIETEIARLRRMGKRDHEAAW